MHQSKRFDDRSVDFHSGRRVSPPMAERRICSCCGLRIVKGYILNNGDQVGDDCAEIISRADTARAVGQVSTADAFDAARMRSSGWKLKSAVRRYLSSTVFA